MKLDEQLGVIKMDVKEPYRLYPKVFTKGNLQSIQANCRCFKYRARLAKQHPRKTPPQRPQDALRAIEDD